MIIPQIVPTSPIIGPERADDGQVADPHVHAGDDLVGCLAHGFLGLGASRGQVRDAGPDQSGQEGIVVLAGIIGILEFLVADRGLELLDEGRGHGLADPQLHEQPDHQRRKIDGQEEEERPDRSGGLDRQGEQGIRRGRAASRGAPGQRRDWRAGARRRRRPRAPGSHPWPRGASLAAGRSLGLAGRLLGVDQTEIAGGEPGQKGAEHRENEPTPFRRSRLGGYERAAASKKSPPTGTGSRVPRGTPNLLRIRGRPGSVTSRPIRGRPTGATPAFRDVPGASSELHTTRNGQAFVEASGRFAAALLLREPSPGEADRRRRFRPDPESG